MMGYPMNYSRVVGRNLLSGDYAGSFNHEDRREQSLSLIRGDMRRLESDQRDERHLAAYATRAGITVAQAKQVLDDFFGAQDVIHERAEVMQSETAAMFDVVQLTEARHYRDSKEPIGILARAILRANGEMK